ncbi:MAG: serine/threonine-protein phosphatase [Planctomycetaceae bacterium]|nr:serine/threonine-protein phosphatase [Planctomycetaceae bacterium]
MASDYIHVDVETVQSPKKTGMPCGDVISCRRTGTGTSVICADGLGSGIRAHIGAQMCVARLFESISQGFSLRKAFSNVAGTMQQSREPDKPFAAFSVVRIRPDGNATVLSYDAPPPILVGRHGASILANRPFSLSGGLAFESHCQLDTGEGILLMSDGITQAGIGYGPNSEWGTDGVIRSVNECLARNLSIEMIPHQIHQESLQRWKGNFGNEQPTRRTARFSQYGKALENNNTPMVSSRSDYGDDCSVTLAYCRNGQTLNILTGPPVDCETDHDVVKQFLEMPGIHVVCGGTTANIVAGYLNEPLQVEQEPTSTIAPPRYAISGIDLVTEGAITLNQVYNIMDEDIAKLSEDSGVTELRLLLGVADRINFIVGGAKNTANDDISFLQHGVLSRKILVPHLAERLERDKKLVTVKYV